MILEWIGNQIQMPLLVFLMDMLGQEILILLE